MAVDDGVVRVAQIEVEVRPIDVTVLRLKPGDVLVAHIPDEWFDAFPESSDEDVRTGILTDFSEAMKSALEKAGVESRVGQLYTVGRQPVKLEILRAGEGGTDAAS